MFIVGGNGLHFLCVWWGLVGLDIELIGGLIKGRIEMEGKLVQLGIPMVFE